MRSKSEDVKECICLIEQYLLRLDAENLNLQEILGIEGMASKIYFPRIFNNIQWVGRKPRIKFDYINALLDIGYNVLFNFIDAILQAFGFDVYYGVLHTCFYMRKSLVCDIMEPMRPIIDWQIRKSINLGQFKKEDFVVIKQQYNLEYKKSAQYVRVFFESILSHKEKIFLYVRDYYRCFMKNKQISEYPVFKLEEL
ncbi:MAG: CRISPR-associated endonuclease Cas1 [bacterium]|nr:CRISPR-associated endonuclease Cas1 [bacterium]